MIKCVSYRLLSFVVTFEITLAQRDTLFQLSCPPFDISCRIALEAVLRAAQLMAQRRQFLPELLLG